MAEKTDTTVVVEDEGLVTVELPAGLDLGDSEDGEAPTLQDLKDAAGGGVQQPAPKAPKEAVRQQPRRSAVDEAAEALTASQAATERERKLRIASDETAQAERNRADTATRLANQKTQEANALLERANNSEIVSVTTAIENGKTELAAAKAALVAAHEAGDAMKMADAQERIGNAAADIRFNTSKKVDLETAVARAKTSHEGRVEAPRPTGTPLDQYVATFSPRAQAWLRAHPECAPIPGGDPVKNNQMMAGHHDAIAQLGKDKEGTDEYFKIIEQHIGEGTAPVSAASQTTPAGEQQPAQRQQAPRQRQPQPSAPPSRDAPGPDGGAPVSRTVRLTADQQEHAFISFPQNRGEDDVTWKKRALGTYAREFIQAKAEGKIGRLGH